MTTYPKYEVNRRVFPTYEDALVYWEVHGGILMQKLDSMTPWHVLCQKQGA